MAPNQEANKQIQSKAAYVPIQEEKPIRRPRPIFLKHYLCTLVLELELIQTQMTQKPMLLSY